MTSERLERLFDDHHQRLYRLARRLARGPEEARDLVQETYLRAARRIEAVPAGAPSEEAWLVRVLVNLCRDRDRRIRVRSRAALRHPPEGSCQPSPESRVVARDAVAKALAKLSPRRRAVVILRLVEEEPVSRIASLLGITAVTVRYHLSMGRRHLAALLRAGDAASPRRSS